MKTPLKLNCIIFLAFFTVNTFSQDTVRMGFIGNSITIGRFLPDEVNDRYPAVLRVMLTELYGDLIEVENFAVSGRTMLKNGDLPIWIEQRYTDALAYAPDICFILLGTNDTKPQNWDFYSSEFYGDYLSMINAFKGKNPDTRFMLAYPPWIRETWFGIDDGRLINEVIPDIEKVITETGAILMDFYNPFFGKDTLYTDPVHPNAAGAKYMAELIYAKLLELELIPEIAGYPLIKEFESDLDSVPENDSVSLSWTTVNADSVKLDNETVDANGSIKVTGTADKSYTLIAYNELGSDTMLINIKYYSTVSVEIIDQGTSERMTVYPNPVGENMIISLENFRNSPARVKMYSISGQLLYEKNFTAVEIQDRQINLSTGFINEGIYLVVVETDSNRFVEKIAK